MFLCDDCRIARFTNGPSITQSYGRCEWCRRAGACSDIPSGMLIARPAVPSPSKAAQETPKPTKLSLLFDNE